MRGETSSVAETSSCHECVYIATGPGRLCSSRREGFGKSCANKFQHQNREQPSPLQNTEGLGGWVLRGVFHPLQTPKGKDNLMILQLQHTTNVFCRICNT